MASLPCVASAQSITESVTVEGRYTPDIIQADRLPIIPSIIALTAPESPMAYDRKGVPAAFAPDALNMPATGWRSTKTYDSSKGYIDLALGSWLNSSLSAGFIPINDDATRLGIYLQHNSTSLWRAWDSGDGEGIPAADRRFRYDETIGADLCRRVADAGTLTAALQYHLGYFNYYASVTDRLENGREKAPTQTLNDLYARVGWTGKADSRLTYSADADVRHFAFRAMYLPSPAQTYPGSYIRTKGERETAVNAGGNVGYRLGDSHANASDIGIGLRYSGVINSVGNDVNRLEATPAYTLSGRHYTLRIGANLAVTADGEKTRFRAAPDVRLDARKGIAALSASIGGGTHLRTLAWRHSMDYYDDPTAGCRTAAYSPLDIRLAFQLNPGGRWTCGVEGKWVTTIDESFGGLYQALLDNDLSLYGDYPASGRIHGFSLGVNAGYEFCRYLTLKADADWQPQKGSKGILNGFDRPEFTAGLSALSCPIEPLKISLDYRLRAKRLLLPGNMSRLDLSASYRISERITVGAELDNLLNRHEEFLPGLPTEGFSAMGGVQIVFN